LPERGAEAPPPGRDAVRALVAVDFAVARVLAIEPSRGVVVAELYVTPAHVDDWTTCD